MSNIINSIIATLLAATERSVSVSTDIIKFAKNEPCYKAMLFLDNNGNFVPVVTFRSPFMGKRTPHKVVNNGLTNQSVILTDDGWMPTEGVSILFIKNGKPHYTVASLTAWELNEKLSFLTSFGWFKGKYAYDVFAKLASFDELNYVKDSSLAEIFDDTLTGVIRQPWFVKIWRAKVESINKKIVDTSR